MSTPRFRRGLGWIAVAVLVFPWRTPDPVGPGERTFVRRLIGPAAGLAASVYWIRFDLALRDGNHDHAYVLAERALDLDTLSPAGWHTLARHLIFDRGSLESEPDPVRRRRWIEAGFAVFERGERRCSDPGQLAYLRGTILALYVAEIADAIDWPGGSAGALEAGRSALEKARTLGFSPAATTLGDLLEHDHGPH